MNRVDMTIIGGGPVGLFGAFYAGLRGMSVRIIDSLPELGGQLSALYPEKFVYDMPGFPAVLAKDLARELVKQGLQFGAEVLTAETAETLQSDSDGYIITTRSGKICPTKTVLISAGIGAFSPTKMGILREDEFHEKGVHYGVLHLAQFARRRVMIVGGGDSAFDWALALQPLASDLKLVHRRDEFRAHEDTVAKVKAAGVPLLLFRTVKELHGDDSLCRVTLEHAVDKTLEEFEVDHLIVNIGFKSSLGPIKTWGIHIEKNQIVVDHQYQTNLRGVFAAGDVCSFEGKLKLIATGVGEATTAVCIAKTMIDPSAKLFPGHSSDMDLSHP